MCLSHLFEFRFAFVFPFIGFHSASWTFLCTHVCISFFKFASVSVFHRFLRFLSFSFISIFCILSRNHGHEFDMQHLHVAHWIKVIMVLVMATVTKPQWEHWTATFHISCFYPSIPHHLSDEHTFPHCGIMSYKKWFQLTVIFFLWQWLFWKDFNPFQNT